MGKSFFQNTCKPEGLGGKMMVTMMNNGHASMAKWGFSHIRIEDNTLILDIGCGGGANIATMLKENPNGKVYGIDYSEVSVTKSAKINNQAIETIYFWPDLAKCFKEVRKTGLLW